MSISIKILENDREIERRILQAAAIDINKTIQKNTVKAKMLLRRLIPTWIRVQPEIASLLAEGDSLSLNAQFGLVGGQGVRVLDDIAEAVIQATDVKILKVDNKLRGGLNIEIQPTDFNNIISSASSIINYPFARLNFLEWLMLKGDTTIVVGYKYEPKSDSGRSEGGIMVRQGAWRVPPQFSGTAENNFITRAFIGREKALEDLFKQIFR
jgi:hypothetical protein